MGSANSHNSHIIVLKILTQQQSYIVNTVPIGLSWWLAVGFGVDVI